MPHKIVKEFFPDLSEDMARDWAWHFTSFPFFKTDDPVTEMRQQLTVVKATMDAGSKPCDFCGLPATKGRFLCEQHEKEWAQYRKEVGKDKTEDDLEVRDCDHGQGGCRGDCP